LAVTAAMERLGSPVRGAVVEGHRSAKWQLVGDRRQEERGEAPAVPVAAVVEEGEAGRQGVPASVSWRAGWASDSTICASRRATAVVAGREASHDREVKEACPVRADRALAEWVELCRDVRAVQVGMGATEATALEGAAAMQCLSQWWVFPM